MVSYEEMLEDAAGVLREVFNLFDLKADDERIRQIVADNSFKSLEAKDQGQTAFFRKGQSGDWGNHFNDELKEAFKLVDSGILIEFGYEVDALW
jgi:hypothetical protein